MKIHNISLEYAGIFASLLLVSQFIANSTKAEPAQYPLLTRIGPQPLPNVMLTLDDSASMLSDFMPEGYFNLLGKTVRLNISDQFLAGFPGDPLRTDIDGWNVPAVKNADESKDSLSQKQYRSPDVNTIWYNPDILYFPWKTNNPFGFPPSQPASARWNPRSILTFDLTKNIINCCELVGSKNLTWLTTASVSVTESANREKFSTSNAKLPFFPGIYYRLTGKNGVVDPQDASHYKRYDINAQGEHAPEMKSIQRTDCRGSRCTMEEERQNFANWFTYYRTRESMVKAVLSEFLPTIVGKVRLGWARLNKYPGNSSVNESERFIEQTVLPFSEDSASHSISKIQYIEPNGSTPLRNAMNAVGSYFSNRNSGTIPQRGNPWLENPEDIKSQRPACRRSMNLILSDGYYNDNYADSQSDWNTTDFKEKYSYAGPAMNPLNAKRSRYSPDWPLSDGKNGEVIRNSLTDIAAKYYIKDLDEQIENQVRPNANDLAYWQHLSQYAIGLGTRGSFDLSTPASRRKVLEQMATGRISSWPDPEKNDANKNDDLWHSTLVSGGEYYATQDIQSLKSALGEALSKATASPSVPSGVALSQRSIGRGLIFISEYQEGTWRGDVKAYQVTDDGSVLADPIWSAGDMLPAPEDRNIYTIRQGFPVDFFEKQVEAATSVKLGANLVNYVRGDSRFEGVEPGQFKPRFGKVLGDFVNSNVLLINGEMDSHYELLREAEAGSGYRKFLSSKKSVAPVIWVGGNDGILHAFDASNGVELFGFVPTSVFSKLALIARPDYGEVSNPHQFLVDGPLAEAEAYIQAAADSHRVWRTLILGSTGAGGRSVFALSMPSEVEAKFTKRHVLWEFSDDAELGYVLSPLQAGRIRNGPWVVLVPNGGSSPTGQAVLFILDAASGSVLKRIKFPDGNTQGLSSVSLVKDDFQEIYAAYCTDLSGNIWRVDFESSDPDDWKVGFGGRPFFRAVANGSAQAITAAVEIVRHPLGGNLLLLGTGKLWDESDASNNQLQTLYALWDETPMGESSANSQSSFVDELGRILPRSKHLLKQEIYKTPAQFDSGQVYFRTTRRALDWGKYKGWFLDLDAMPGLRMIWPAKKILGWGVFSTITPPGQAQICEVKKAEVIQFLLDAFSGASPDYSVHDLNADGEVNSVDHQLANSYSTEAGANSENLGVGGILGLGEGQIQLQMQAEAVQLAVSGLEEGQSGNDVCVGSSVCEAGQCLVSVRSSSGHSENLCIKPACKDLNGDGVADDLCCTNPGAAGCGGRSHIQERVIKRLLIAPN